MNSNAMKRSVLATLLSFFSMQTALASPTHGHLLPTNNIPIPVLRDHGSDWSNTLPDKITTGTILASSTISAMGGSFNEALNALDDENPLHALAIRNSMPKDSLDRAVLTFAIAQSGLDQVPSQEILNAMQDLADWPGISNLVYRWERAYYRENPNPANVIAAFANKKPKTAEGAILLTGALVTQGHIDQARATIRPFWHEESLDEKEEDEILSRFGKILERDDHKKRMDMLLYRDRVTQAERFSELGNAQSLFRARAATIRKQDNADRLIRSVHRSWHKDPSYLFTKIERARRTQRWSDAANLLAQTPKDTSTLVNSYQWWIEQRIVSRILYERGDVQSAYKIAANHVAQRPSDIIEAEFHAGFYALRGLNNPQIAARHFNNILDHATTPRSTARAYYWLGRSAEMGGQTSNLGNASNYFQRAARYQTTYYGQLAGARINQSDLNVTYPKPTQQDRINFANRNAVKAIQRLEALDHGWRSNRIYRGLAYQLKSPGELAILAAMAEQRDDHQLSLQIGLIAFGRGLDVAALAYPLGAIPKSANIKGTGTALAYSIARQESTFNKAAVSPANARGLLQILPGTAKRVAKDYGLPYSTSRLTKDAAYNATLGAYFLNEQITNFSGSYIMTFIGYNAGPRRVPQWIERFGDPRGKDIDEIVDWVEMIPFTETRNYVQRVMENYQVYKMRLGQQADIVADMRFGRP